MSNIVCFHNPNEENGCLSNWYLSEFNINNILFTSMEQYMMYMKAVTFKDMVMTQNILSTNDVAKIKDFGRKVRNYNETIWNGLRQLIVYDGLRAKFTQNKELYQKLLVTNQSVLAECAVQDKIWGIGLSMKDPYRFDMSNWRGKNLLGFTLMKVRTDIS